MSPPIRVIFADDSVTIRRFLAQGMESADDIEVVGVAKHGREALGLVRSLRPDVLLLDVEMPVMDGIDTVRALRQFNTDLPVLMFSSLTKTGGEATLDAISAGANAYAQKPCSGAGPEAALSQIKQNLIPQIRKLAEETNAAKSRRKSTSVCEKGGTTRSSISVVQTCPIDATKAADADRSSKTPSPRPAARKSTEPCNLVVIGSSTGGPNALAELLPMISSQIKVPILIAQHMPTVFTKLLAERLNKLTELEVREARNGECPRAGTVLIAPGDYHLEIKASGASPKIILQQGPEENSCRPAVDVLFRSAAEVYRDRVLGVVLTGMGRDGTKGCEHLAQKGSRIIVQDEASCVIWGMPRAVTEAGLADEVLPLQKIASAIHKYTPVVKRSALVAQ